MKSQNTGSRVAITGMGLITPLGMGVESNWQALLAGQSNIGRITHFDPQEYALPTQFAGEVADFDPSQFLDRKQVRHYDRFIQLAAAASDLALADANLQIDDLPRDRTGILIGSGMGGIEEFVKNAVAMHVHGARRVSPFFVPSIISNMAAGMLAIRYKTRGPNFAIISACATGSHSIGEGYRMLQRGETDVMIVGGSEAAITPLGMAGFAAAKALSRRNEAPEKASRPFDRDRDGFVMSEGAGILILEREDFARARGARIYGHVAGVGYSSDAYHPTAPDPEGSGGALAIELAFRDAGLQPRDVGYVNAHATSTELGDRSEAKAIRKAFGTAVEAVAVSSTKSVTGHLLGAAGAVEAAYSLLALHHQVLPPTINLDNPDPECQLNHVANRPRPAKVDFALSNAFGFGGTNTALIFARD